MKKIIINTQIHIIKTRKMWEINPIERIVASKKKYSRACHKRDLKKSFPCEL